MIFVLQETQSGVLTRGRNLIPQKQTVHHGHFQVSLPLKMSFFLIGQLKRLNLFHSLNTQKEQFDLHADGWWVLKYFIFKKLAGQEQAWEGINGDITGRVIVLQ